EMVNEIRMLVREAAPTATEAFKWAQPVYEANGPFAWVRAFQAHVTFGFWRGRELADPKGMLESSGERMAHVRLSNLKDIKKTQFKAWVREAVKLNQLKGNPTMKKKK
ncbi:MAG TPA: DUF1801 domain-containing protein, partial [Anaerolineae bacterium]